MTIEMSKEVVEAKKDWLSPVIIGNTREGSRRTTEFGTVEGHMSNSRDNSFNDNTIVEEEDAISIRLQDSCIMCSLKEDTELWYFSNKCWQAYSSSLMEIIQ